MTLTLNCSSVSELVSFIPWRWNRPKGLPGWDCQIKQCVPGNIWDIFTLKKNCLPEIQIKPGILYLIN